MKNRKYNWLILALVMLLGTGLSFTPTGSRLADQVDFPLIYIDDDAGDGGVGSQVDPYNELSDINWTTGGDNSIFDYLAGTPSESPQVLLQDDDDWRETLTVGCSGTVAYPIIIGSYGSGADPIINGSDIVSTWTSGELIVNGTMEVDDNWVNFLSPPINERSGTQKHAGSYSRKFSADSEYDGISNIGDRFSFVANQVYTYSFWVYPDDSTNIHWLLRKADDSDWAINTNVTGLNQDQWNQVTSDYTALSSGNSVYIVFSSTAAQTGDEVWYIDDVSIALKAPNVWQATLTTEPTQVFFDGTIGTKQVSAAACTSARDWFWVANVLYIYYEEDPDGAVVIEASARDYGIDIDAKNYITLQDLDVKNANNTGIFVQGGSSNTTIDTVTSRYNYKWGIYIVEIGTTQDDGVIQDCTVNYNGGTGIQIVYDADGWLIDSNTVHNNGTVTSNSDPFDYTGGIKLWGNATGVTNCTIQSNTVYSNGLAAQDANRGVGIWIDTCNSGNVVRYNNVYSNNGHGIHIENTNSSSVSVYYNLCHDHVDSDHIAGIRVYATIGTCDDNLIYNNVCYGNYYGLLVSSTNDAGTTSVSDNTFKNNIFSGNTTREIVCTVGGDNDGTDGSGNIYLYNCLGAEATNFIEWAAGTFKSTYDAWETSYGATTNSVEADPLMTDPANDDFTLQTTSPCIDAGIDVSLTEDYNDVSVPLRGDMGTNKAFISVGGNLYIIPGDATEGSPDIGAYEYIAPYKIKDGHLYLRLSEKFYLQIMQPGVNQWLN